MALFTSSSTTDTWTMNTTYYMQRTTILRLCTYIQYIIHAYIHTHVHTYTPGRGMCCLETSSACLQRLSFVLAWRMQIQPRSAHPARPNQWAQPRTKVWSCRTGFPVASHKSPFPIKTHRYTLWRSILTLIDADNTANGRGGRRAERLAQLTYIPIKAPSVLCILSRK